MSHSENGHHFIYQLDCAAKAIEKLRTPTSIFAIATEEVPIAALNILTEAEASIAAARKALIAYGKDRERQKAEAQ